MYIYTYTHHLQPLKAMRYSGENQPNMNRTHVLETTQCCLKQAKMKRNVEISHSRIRGFRLKMPVVPKWIHRFTTVAIKISASFFSPRLVDLGKILLKFIQKYKGIRIA